MTSSALPYRSDGHHSMIIIFTCRREIRGGELGFLGNTFADRE
jgi:hypothetical protein